MDSTCSSRLSGSGARGAGDGAVGLAAGGTAGAGGAGILAVDGARTTCLQCGQRTCFPSSSSPTPILRPQKGHGKVKV